MGMPVFRGLVGTFPGSVETLSLSSSSTSPIISKFNDPSTSRHDGSESSSATSSSTHPTTGFSSVDPPSSSSTFLGSSSTPTSASLSDPTSSSPTLSASGPLTAKPYSTSSYVYPLPSSISSSLYVPSSSLSFPNTFDSINRGAYSADDHSSDRQQISSDASTNHIGYSPTGHPSSHGIVMTSASDNQVVTITLTLQLSGPSQSGLRQDGSPGSSFLAHGGAVVTFLMVGFAIAVVSILALLRCNRRRDAKIPEVLPGSYPNEKRTYWSWTPKSDSQRNRQGSVSSRRPFDLDEWAPTSPQSSLNRGVSMVSTDMMTMSPMAPTAGLIANHSDSPFDNVSEMEGGAALSRGLSQAATIRTISTGGAPSTNPLTIMTSEPQRAPSLFTISPVDYSPPSGISGYLGTVPEGRTMNTHSDPGHVSRSLSISAIQPAYPGSVARSQSLPHGRPVSSASVLYHADISGRNSSPARNASASRSSKRSAHSTSYDEDNRDPFITPPVSPMETPSMPLAERQSSTRSSKTKHGSSRSSSIDHRLDPGVLRATWKQQSRENSQNSGRVTVDIPSRSRSTEEGDVTDERSRYLGVNEDDVDGGSSVHISTANQSALSLDDAEDYSRRVLSTL